MQTIGSQEARSMGRIAAMLQSEHTPTLFGGKQAHDPALKLVGQLVRHTENDDFIIQFIGAALPPDYGGNELGTGESQVRISALTQIAASM